MDKYEIITPEYLCKRLDYCDSSGRIFWRMPERSLFNSDKGWRIFVRKYVGKEALSHINSWGYKCGCINKYAFLAHRVIYAMHFQKWPTMEIDHIDGDKLNNRVLNLRECSGTENRRNMPMQCNNTSGYVGVTQSQGKWVARIGAGSGSSRIHLGTFEKLEDALAARAEAEIKLGYSKNHGR